MSEEAVIEQNPAENVLQAEPPAEVVAETPETTSEVVAETTEQSEPIKETPEEADGRKNPWYLKRIATETRAKQEAEQKAADLQAIVERLQTGKETQAPPAPAVNTPDFQTAVQREAARMRLAEDSTAIRDEGYRTFGRAFGDTLAVLNAAGAVSDDIVLDLIAVDKANAHKILASLADDPERASALATMDPRRRTVELTRIAMATNTPTTQAAPAKAAPRQQVSRAPAPPPPVEPTASKVVDWRKDDASDAEFDRGFREMMAKRNTRR